MIGCTLLQTTGVLPPAPVVLPPAPVVLPPAPVVLPPAPVVLPPAPVVLPPAPAVLPPVLPAELPAIPTFPPAPAAPPGLTHLSFVQTRFTSHERPVGQGPPSVPAVGASSPVPELEQDQTAPEMSRQKISWCVTPGRRAPSNAKVFFMERSPPT